MCSSARSGAARSAWAPRRALPFPDAPTIAMSALPPPSAPQFCWLPLQDLRSTAFRYLLQHGVPGPTWGGRKFLPTARRPGRTRQGGASPQLLTVLGWGANAQAQRQGRLCLPAFSECGSRSIMDQSSSIILTCANCLTALMSHKALFLQVPTTARWARGYGRPRSA